MLSASGVFFLGVVVVGILLSIGFCVISNKDNAIMSKYDERQKVSKGKSYTYGFYAMVVCEFVVCCLTASGYPDLHIPGTYYHVLSIFIGFTVVCVHDVWNRSYWGMNNNQKAIKALFVVAFVLNLAVCILPYVADHEVAMRTIGSMECYDLPYPNIFCVAFMFIVGATGLIRHLTDKKEEE